MSAGRKKRRKSDTSAFTLIELALVAIILLAIIGLSVPVFRNTLSDLAARDAAYNIAKLINYAQEQAVINNGKNFKIWFDIAKGRYRFCEYVVNNAVYPPEVKEIPIGGRFGRLRALPKGVKFTLEETPPAARIEILFYPDGHCSKAGIDLYSAQGGHQVISTKGFGAKVELKDLNVKD